MGTTMGGGAIWPDTCWALLAVTGGSPVSPPPPTASQALEASAYPRLKLEDTEVMARCCLAKHLWCTGQ